MMVFAGFFLRGFHAKKSIGLDKMADMKELLADALNTTINFARPNIEKQFAENLSSLTTHITKHSKDTYRMTILQKIPTAVTLSQFDSRISPFFARGEPDAEVFMKSAKTIPFLQGVSAIWQSLDDAQKAEIWKIICKLHELTCVWVKLGDPAELTAEATKLLGNEEFKKIVGALFSQLSK